MLDDFGFHPNFFNLEISRCAIFISPFQPLPSSTPPVVLIFIFSLILTQNFGTDVRIIIDSCAI